MIVCTEMNWLQCCIMSHVTLNKERVVLHTYSTSILVHWGCQVTSSMSMHILNRTKICVCMEVEIWAHTHMHFGHSYTTSHSSCCIYSQIRSVYIIFVLFETVYRLSQGVILYVVLHFKYQTQDLSFRETPKVKCQQYFINGSR